MKNQNPTPDTTPPVAVTHSPLMALWATEAWEVLARFAAVGGTDVA